MLKTFGSHVRGNVVGYIALFVALGGTTYAATGGNFILGQPNTARSTTSLTRPGANTGKSLQVTNNSIGAGATALGLNVASGHAPFTVNSGKKVTNLNADKLDGQDASAFRKSGCGPTVAGTGVMVQVGPTCIDKYEASVWSSPTGGTQYGVNTDDYPCDDNGQNCSNIYARSVPGVTPSTAITWFQAQAALTNSGKRLPTSAEWQAAVRGTPDPGTSPGSEDCNTNSSGPEPTGERANCVSSQGVNDMVGNLNEWVADWMSFPNTCRSWGSFSDDQMCLSGASTTVDAPGALTRGGAYNFGAQAGPFAVAARQLSDTLNYGGFRGVR